jgi:hypothetical protein
MPVILSAMPASRSKRIFLSAVTRELGSYRESLAQDLRLPNVEVKVQEDFIVGGGTTLGKIDNYIRLCDAVVHLIGDVAGAMPADEEVLALRERYPDLAARLPAAPLSYTQWEAYLAIHYSKPLYVYRAESTAPRDDSTPPAADEARLQSDHFDQICRLGRDRGRFQDREALRAMVLRSLVEFLAQTEPAPPIALTSGAQGTERFLTPDDFLATDHSAAKPLVVGFRPSLAMVRDRQYMPRPIPVAKACERLEKMFAEQARATVHELNVFWMTGRSGTGKSVLLLQVMERMVRNGRRVVWLNDDAAAIVPLLAALEPDAGLSDDQIPDLVFIDDMYAPRGQQEIDLDAVRRLVGTAPDRRWPIVVTCGPPEFERQLARDSGRDCMQIHPWRLLPVRAGEANALRRWFSARMPGASRHPGTAFKQADGLIVSMTFEMVHGRLEPFARRFYDRLRAKNLDGSLQVPLAMNRLYVNAPAGWLSEDDWERLDELNQDVDFSILESPHSTRYLRLTHPHISDVIYQAVRVPGNPRAYANDLAEAIRRSWDTDLFTLRQLLRVVASGNERLSIIDMDHLAKTIATEWRRSELLTLRADPAVLADVYVSLSSWAHRQPELKLDERFGMRLFETARDALRDAGERWPVLWSALYHIEPHDEVLLREALQWLPQQRSQKARAWRLPWLLLAAKQRELSEADWERLLVIGYDWLGANPEGDAWGSVFEVLSRSKLPCAIERSKLLSLGQQWLESKPNRNQWYRVWHRLLADPDFSKADRDDLLKAGFEWLKLFEIRRDWVRIWVSLRAEREYPDGIDRPTLMQMGLNWLVAVNSKATGPSCGSNCSMSASCLPDCASSYSTPGVNCSSTTSSESTGRSSGSASMPLRMSRMMTVGSCM